MSKYCIFKTHANNGIWMKDKPRFDYNQNNCIGVNLEKYEKHKGS